MPVVIAIVLFGGLIAGIIALARYMEKRRTEAVHGWGQANGFMPDPDWNGFHGSLQQFKLFNQGHSRKLRNLIRATRGDQQLAICDYQYTTGSGKHQHTTFQTLCVVRATKAPLPHFFARRQVAFFDFLGKVFGGQDVNFDEDPAFSKAYVLQSQGAEDELRRLFNEPVRSAFTQLAPKGVQVEGRDDLVVLHYGRRLKPERLGELVDDSVSVRQTLG
ncbi:MAG: hypothetical protein IPJ65_16220 [Archangiaceae bacterium]|nr:hypothetical protein [Archangiaceae bacterium]